jgi:O-antigen/teichoic acid export membrane protein
MSEESTGAPAPNAEKAMDRDVSVALKNALKLGLSLTATWIVGLGARFLHQRFLGPELFGRYLWADSTAALAFVFASLGIDTYIQREVSVRPEHASDFFGGTLVIRLGVMSALLAGLMAFAYGKESDPALLGAVFVFGLAYAMTAINNSLAALLQASTKVGRLAIANVATKLLWGAAVVGTLFFTRNFAVLAAPLLAGELLKASVLVPAVRKELNLELRWNGAAAKAALITSIPFFVNTISYTMGNKVDVTLLRGLVKGVDEEVGFYGAAQSIASLAMLLAPLEGWVITPLLTRAVKRDESEFFAILRRAVEGILLVAIPATMMISLGAETWMRAASGSKYLPGAASLAQLAPSFVFTYIAMLLATALIIQNRSWTVTLISLSRLILQPVLMFLVVPYARDHFGRGGAGVGDAIVFTVLEAYVAIAFFTALGRRAFDLRSVLALVKSLAAFGVTAAVHRLAAPLGQPRLILDGVVYLVIVFGTKAIATDDIKWVIGMVRNRKANRA